MDPENQWSVTKRTVAKKMEATFRECPQCFFSEHDIHSVLYCLAKEELKQHEISSEQITRDGHITSLVHHEYPTPFRCDMHGHTFRRAGEKERTRRGGLYKRGHYDLVVLNPYFVKANELDAICGKDYAKFRSMLAKVNVEPLIWACEVLYFPRIKKLPKKAIQTIEQDALKVRETLQYEVGEHHKFCRIGSVLVLTSHLPEETSNLERKIAELAKDLQIEITFTTA